MKTVLVNLLVVGCGGFVGTAARYGIGAWAQRQPAWSGFPYATLVVNLLGCLLIGVGAGLAESRQLFGPEARLFVLVGILGGFTTFSAFGYETMALQRNGELLRAGLNVGANVILGLGLVWLGLALTAGK